MRILRSLSAGLLLSAYLILEYGIEFSRWYGLSAPISAFHLGVHAVNPSLAEIMGGNAYGPTIFILGCLGVGIFVGGTIYAWIEWFYWNVLVAGLEEVIKPVMQKLRRNREAAA